MFREGETNILTDRIKRIQDALLKDILKWTFDVDYNYWKK